MPYQVSHNQHSDSIFDVRAARSAADSQAEFTVAPLVADGSVFSQAGHNLPVESQIPPILVSSGQYKLLDRRRQRTLDGSWEPIIDPEDGEAALSLDNTNKSETPDSAQQIPLWGPKQGVLRAVYAEEAHRAGERGLGARQKSMLSAVDRLGWCGTHGEYQWMDCGHSEEMELHVHHCGVRGCTRPGCQRAYSAKQAARYEATVRARLPEKKKDWGGRILQSLTLTMPSGVNAGQDVSVDRFQANYKKIWDSYAVLCRYFDRRFGRGLWGSLESIEVGRYGMTHLHCLLFSPLVTEDELRSVWYPLTGGHQIKCEQLKGRVTKKGIKLDPIAAGIREICKYLAKPQATGGDFYIQAVASVAARGCRAVRSRGLFYGKCERPPAVECGICGCTNWVVSPSYVLVDGRCSDHDQREALGIFYKHNEFRESLRTRQG